MDVPKMPMLCATLSSIINNQDIEHFDKAADILWKLYRVVPEMVPFRSFGHLLIDILVFVCFLYVLLCASVLYSVVILRDYRTGA